MMRRVLLPCLLLLVALSAPATAEKYVFSDWHLNSFGYDKALELHEQDGRPVILYFRTDWCQYCKKFDAAVLADDGVQEYMRKLPKVVINPEVTYQEMSLAQRYRVKGYPSLYLVNGGRKYKHSKKLNHGVSAKVWLRNLKRMVGPLPETRTESVANRGLPKAEALQKEGKHKEAVDLLDVAIARQASEPQLYYLRARSYVELRKLGDAMDDLEIAIALKDDYTDARIELAQIQVKLEMYRDARKHLDAVIAKDAQHTKAHWLRAVAWDKSGSRDRAKRDYAVACKLGHKPSCARK